LIALAKQAAAWRTPSKRGISYIAQENCRADEKVIFAVGTPLCVTSLDEGILDTLKAERRTIRRMPLAEFL